MKESTREIIFKFESTISVFGRITRKNREIKNNSFGTAGGLNRSLIEVWLAVLSAVQGLDTTGGVTIIDPIAVYVE